MNKYVFPGADASIPLNWVLKELEKVGFEAKQIDVLGVHYSATLHRWYQVRDPLPFEAFPAACSEADLVLSFLELALERGEGPRQVRLALVPHLVVLPRVGDHRLAPGRRLRLPAHAPQEHQRL